MKYHSTQADIELGDFNHGSLRPIVLFTVAD